MALAELTRLAQRDLKSAFNELMSAGVPYVVVREGLIEAVYAITTAYGDLAGAASNEFFEATSPTGAIASRMAAMASLDEVSEDVRWAVRHLFNGDDPQKTLADLSGCVQRLVMGVARGSTLENAGWRQR